jgi:hypothetical protein
MLNDNLTDDTFLMYAIKHYNNPSCRGIQDFNDDLRRLRYIKRLLGRYRQTGVIKERLVINHLVVFFNVFGVEAATRMLFFKIKESLWPELKTFLVYLNYMPQVVIVSQGLRLPESEIPLDQVLVEILRKL